MVQLVGDGQSLHHAIRRGAGGGPNDSLPTRSASSRSRLREASRSAICRRVMPTSHAPSAPRSRSSPARPRQARTNTCCVTSSASCGTPRRRSAMACTRPPYRLKAARSASGRPRPAPRPWCGRQRRDRTAPRGRSSRSRRSAHALRIARCTAPLVAS